MKGNKTPNMQMSNYQWTFASKDLQLSMDISYSQWTSASKDLPLPMEISKFNRHLHPKTFNITKSQ